MLKKEYQQALSILRYEESVALQLTDYAKIGFRDRDICSEIQDLSYIALGAALKTFTVDAYSARPKHETGTIMRKYLNRCFKSFKGSRSEWRDFVDAKRVNLK